MLGLNLGMDRKWREITESDRFREQLLNINQNNARLADKFIDGVKLTLSRNPYWGDQVTEHIWTVNTTQRVDPDLMPMIVHYTFNDNAVHLLNVKINF